MPARRMYVVFFTLAALAVTAEARAAGTARLVYLRGQGAESCADDDAMRDAVAARLGYDPFTPFALETLFAEIDKEKNGFTARMKLVGADGAVRGARTLATTGPCEELTSSLALTISLAIDPMAFSRRGPPEGLPPAERPVEPVGDGSAAASPSRDEPPPSEPAAPRPESTRLHLGVGAGALVSAGAAPAPALGFLVYGEARYDRFGAVLEGRADLPSGTDADVPGRVSSSLLAVSALPCFYTGPIFACASGSIGRLAAKGLDVSTPGSSSALWGAIGGRLGGEISLGATWHLRVHGDATAVLTRYVLRIGGENAFRYSPFAGALGVAFGATFR